MPNPGSVAYFDGDLVINWSYDADKQRLTVNAAYKNQPVGNPAVLTPQDPTGNIQGTVLGHGITIGLQADFSTNTLTIAARQTNPTKNAGSTVDF